MLKLVLLIHIESGTLQKRKSISKAYVRLDQQIVNSDCGVAYYLMSK